MEKITKTTTATDKQHETFLKLDKLENAIGGIELALEVLDSHFFVEYHEELARINELYPGACRTYLETFASMVQIATDRIESELIEIKAICDTMWDEMRQEKQNNEGLVRKYIREKQTAEAAKE